jgi:hypothetical protein
MRLSKRCLVLMSVLLISCGPPQPRFETHYEFVMPPTPQSRFCATTCLSTQQICNQNCDIQRTQCRHSAELESERRYNDYLRERQMLGREVKKYRSSFETYGSCGSDYGSCASQCASYYQQCFTSCGGQVIPHTTCVANCHLIGQPPLR